MGSGLAKVKPMGVAIGFKPHSQVVDTRDTPSCVHCALLEPYTIWPLVPGDQCPLSRIMAHHAGKLEFVGLGTL